MNGEVLCFNLTRLTIGMTALLSPAFESRVNMLTIESGAEIYSNERWHAFSEVLKDYWQGILNLTHQIAT
jgi:hypothetical protein